MEELFQYIELATEYTNSSNPNITCMYSTICSVFILGHGKMSH